MKLLMSLHRVPPHQLKRGFTLIEMMIAMTILAILFSVVYSAINSAVNARAANRNASDALVKLHRGLSLMEQDIHHAIARFSQFPNEDWKPSLAHKPTQEGEVLSLSRHGWPITLNQNASNLARVAYELALDEKAAQPSSTDAASQPPSYKLYRVYWRDIDSLTNEPTRRRVVLRGIKRIHFRFLDEQNKWTEEWPSEVGIIGNNEFDEALAGSDMAAFQRLPRAVELILEMHGLGKIRRVFILPEGHGI